VKEPSGNTVKAVAFFSTSALTVFDGKNPGTQTRQLIAWSELSELVAKSIGRNLEYYVFDYETNHERIGLLRKFIHWLRTGEEQAD
jgi:hypothetical protein